MEEQVNIPALLSISDGSTWFVTLNEIWLCSLLESRVILGKSGIISSKFGKRFGYGRADSIDRVTEKSL